ncbi:MAG: carboxypeptidase regulatory-like domain-containing protein [Acidobacteriota bacterium]
MTTVKLTAVAAALGVVSLVPAGELKGTVHATGVRTSADAVVYVDTIAGRTFAPPEEHPVIDQKDMVFVPHVLPVVAGTTVDFKNSDPFMHNVFTPEKCAERFNLGSWPQGQMRSYTFKMPCVATLLCNVHPEMEAFVLVLPTPYFAVTDESGAFHIPDLPDGTYTVKVWHAKLKEVSQEVTVSGTTDVNFEMKR